MPQAMKKFLQQKTAVDKEWEKLEKISAWNLTKVRSKKEVIDEARTTGAKSSFCIINGHMSFENGLNWRQTTKNTKVGLFSEVVIVKDDSGSYAVFT